MFFSNNCLKQPTNKEKSKPQHKKRTKRPAATGHLASPHPEAQTPCSTRAPDIPQRPQQPPTGALPKSRPPAPRSLPEGSPRRVHPTARRFLSRQPAGQNLRRRRKPAGARCRPCRGLRKAKASAERGPPPPPPARSRSACRAQPPAQPGTKVAMATARVPPPRRGCNNSSAPRPAHRPHTPRPLPEAPPSSVSRPSSPQLWFAGAEVELRD